MTGNESTAACVNARDVDAIWALGQRLAEQFGTPQNIEWAIKDGELFVLQSRPITTDVASQEIIETTRCHLQSLAAGGGGPWVLHNLAETLPHPTPLTWSVVQEFMSGRGGLGLMYRRAGFEPSELACREGFLELAAGRVYMDASRAPEMFFESFPFRYDVTELKNSPGAAQSPPTVPRGSIRARLRAARRLKRIDRNLRRLARSVDRELRTQRFPALREYVAYAKRDDLGSASSERLIELWQRYEENVLTEFGSWSLLPGLIAAMAIADLQEILEENLWQTECEPLAQQLSVSKDLSETLLSDAELYEVGRGDQTLDSWLGKYGHRGVGEFDLASPRSRERPDTALKMAAGVASAAPPLERHRKSFDKLEGLLAEVVGQLPRGKRAELRRRVELVRRYVICREDAKHYLMLGYDLLRDLALEASRRLGVGDGVFYLTRDELFQSLQVGLAPLALIRQRRQTYHNEERVSLPTVIDVEELAKPVAPVPCPVADHDLRGLAISPGRASGAARILRSPTDEGGILRGEVLVCTSTDPSWTPLFARAAALVLETGGVLSHGAIVAREMGIPGVIVPGATQLIGEGKLITVDGVHGLVHYQERATIDSPPPVDESDTFVPFEQRPPGPGRKDRIAARWRNWLGLAWSLVLVAFYVLPDAWCRQPTLSAIDRLAWPSIRILGKPATVILVALVVALSTGLIEVLLTDPRRLAVAKRRAKVIERELAKLPPSSPRRSALKRLVAPVQHQAIGAAMVPVGFLFGPMILSVVWLSERMDPAKFNPPPGASVSIVASVDSDHRQPIRLEVPAGFVIDPATPATQTLPPLRETLTELLDELRRPGAERTTNAALAGVLQTSQQNAADNLKAYLDQGIPPQGLTWSIHSPADAQGTFSAIATSGGERHTIRLSLGDRDPPLPTKIDCEPTNQIKSLEIFFGGAKSEPIFYRPFAWLSRSDVPSLRWLSTTQVGWLSLYLAVYLPALFGCRWIWPVKVGQPRTLHAIK